jgi:ferredoxin
VAHVVCEPCVNCKYTDCVTACPVDAFREGKNMLVIHPDECICCGACVPECPTEAIFAEEDVPARWAEFVDLNARLARDGGWPNINQKKECMGHLADGKRASESCSSRRRSRADLG